VLGLLYLACFAYLERRIAKLAFFKANNKVVTRIKNSATGYQSPSLEPPLVAAASCPQDLATRASPPMTDRSATTTRPNGPVKRRPKERRRHLISSLAGDLELARQAGACAVRAPMPPGRSIHELVVWNSRARRSIHHLSTYVLPYIMPINYEFSVDMENWC